MKLLVVGSGGREHALVRKFARAVGKEVNDFSQPGQVSQLPPNGLSFAQCLQAALELCRKTKSKLIISKLDRLSRNYLFVRKLADDAPDAVLFCAPGNPGTSRHATNVPIGATDISALARFASGESVGLTVVGPEQPLADGLADEFEAAGLPVFGPVAAAARIESSKAFSKELMDDCGVPTAAFRVFDDPGSARAFAAGIEPPIVIKASGLAGGKGAIICADHFEADEAIRDLMELETLGSAGARIVIEEFMRGEELSVFFVTDGKEAVPLAPARDHKRRYAGDLGPNTGGMGAFSPVRGGDMAMVERIKREIAEPVLAGMAERGFPYRGFLYAGVMLTGMAHGSSNSIAGWATPRHR